MVDARVALLISGVCGFSIGLLYANWQWAVEHSQILAGLVTYPAGSPPDITSAKMWSIVNQGGALLLRAGMSELTLSRGLSALVGMLSFQALTAVCFALGRNGLVAVGCALVIAFSRVTDHDAVYAITLFNTPHTYGTFGLSLAVLAIGLIGMGWLRTGAFVLGISPAVQGVIGSWCVVVAALAVLPNRESRSLFRTAWPWFVAALAVTVLSYGAHRLAANPVLGIPPSEASRYLRAFVATWDDHRIYIELTNPAVTINLTLVVLATVSLLALAKVLDPTSKVVLRVIAIGGLLSVAAACWPDLVPVAMPDRVLALMPGRMLNVNVMIAAAVLFGLAALLKPPLLAMLSIASLAVGLVAASPGEEMEPRFGVDVESLSVLLWGLRILILVYAADWIVARTVRWRGLGQRLSWRSGGRALSLVVIVISAFAAFHLYRDADRFPDEERRMLSDWKTDPVFAAAAASRGRLLTGGDLFLIQLRTRRPLLIDGGTLDTLPYALEAAPETNRILREVYGIDLFDPPEGADKARSVRPEANRRVWETFSPDRWAQVGRDFAVTQVVTPDHWRLQLPLVAESGGLRLYSIPKNPSP
jgi:hypothetical protein